MNNASQKFFLDSNIDGYYLDSNNNLQKIENMIQVVNAGDGSRILPGKSTDQYLNFTEREMLEINENPLFVDELQAVLNDNRGHGLLYDKDGILYGRKGDLVFRDGKGNKSNISSITNKVDSINQDEFNNISMRDLTLDAQITTKKGMSIDQLLKAARTKYNPFGLGNIVQATRNSARNSSKVSTYTTILTSEDQIWVTASASVSGEGTVELVDFTTGDVLDTVYTKAQSPADIITAFLSYTGNLPVVDNVISQETCDVAIYNSFFKKFFKRLTDTPLNIHEIGIRVTTGSDFLIGAVNMLVMDEPPVKSVSSGEIIIDGQDTATVAFKSSLPDTNYSISVSTEILVRCWYDNKTESGFEIKFEDKYTGRIFWSIVYKT